MVGAECVEVVVFRLEGELHGKEHEGEGCLVCVYITRNVNDDDQTARQHMVRQISKHVFCIFICLLHVSEMCPVQPAKFSTYEYVHQAQGYSTWRSPLWKPSLDAEQDDINDEAGKQRLVLTPDT